MKDDTTIIKDIRSFLKVKQQIEIDFDHPDFLEEYASRVQGIGEDHITVATPVAKCAPAETHCWIYYVYKDQRYGFESKVEGYQGDYASQMILTCPKEILRLQRRKYFRVAVDIPVTCRIPGGSIHDPEGVFPGTIQNISAGGVLVETEKEISIGSEILLFFSLDQDMDLDDIPSRVVRGGIIEKTKKDLLYEYGIEFYNIHGRLRDAIMRFVFNQLILLKKEGGI